MGYALFTARKLMLQNRLNQMNYRLMVLSQQQQDLTQKTANIEMQNGFNASINSIFVNNQMTQQYDALLGKTDLTDSQRKAEIEALGRMFSSMETDNKIRAQKDMNNLKSVQAISNQIDLEMKKLDTQVKETTAEMEQVEKAEETAIKNSAPKYGGGAG